MRIRKLRWKNFKNYKEEGEMVFPENGIVNIIYGKNGDGKSNLHQLFRWILYGTTQLNKTDSSKIYNLNYENDYPEGKSLEVMGEIEFEFEGEEYSLTRTAEFWRNGRNEFDQIQSDVSLQHLINFNWEPIDFKVGKKFINEILPEYLSDYFLFDGEKMIADLNLKSKDSAKKLKEMLFSIFNLDIIQQAVSDLGNTNSKRSILGRLYTQKSNASSNEDVKKKQIEYNRLCDKYEYCQNLLNDHNSRAKELKKEKDVISEEIGNRKSKGELERNRSNLVEDLDSLEKDEVDLQGQFGDSLNQLYLKALAAKRFLESGIDYTEETFQIELPQGLNPDLIEYLTQENNHTCICGRALTNREKEKIKSYLDILPPNSYQKAFDQLKRNSQIIVNNFTADEVERIYIKYLQKLDYSEQKQKEIDRLDEKMKSMDDIESLVSRRQQIEKELRELQENIEKEAVSVRIYQAKLEKIKKKIDELTSKSQECKKYQYQIEIIEEVKRMLEKRLEEEGNKYSKTLQINMQSLLDKMLHSKRYVTVSPDFTVSIKDQHGDESKSEGQFAVASFAYIGGILKLLEDEQNLSSKTFPLILDGPFSKLDDQVRNNVAMVLPDIVPQMIIFSKDDLSEVFSEEYIASVYSIKSQNAQTEARIVKGKTGIFNGN